MAAAPPERSASGESTMSFEKIGLEEARGAPEYREGKPVYPEIRDPDSPQAQLEKLRDLLAPKNLAARLGVSVARLRELMRIKSTEVKSTKKSKGGRRTKKTRKRTRRPRRHRTRRHQNQNRNK